METAQIVDIIHTIFHGFTIKTKISTSIEVLIYLTGDERITDLLTHFFIVNNTMGIKSLNKQGNVSGAFILTKLEELARAIGLKSISLNDNSEIHVQCGRFGINISLSTLYLLTHGMSWYNSKGYVDPQMVRDDIPGYHRDLINTPMHVFIEKVIQELVKNDTYEYFDLNKRTFDSAGNKTNYIYHTFDNIRRQIPELTLDLKVKDYFAIVKSILQNPNMIIKNQNPTSLECDFFYSIKTLIHLITLTNIFILDEGSIKILAGKRSKKRNATHSKTKRKMMKRRKPKTITFMV